MLSLAAALPGSAKDTETLAVSLANTVVALYLLYRGIVGFRTWA